MSGCLNCSMGCCFDIKMPHRVPIQTCCPALTKCISLKEGEDYPAGTVVVGIKGAADGTGARPYVYAPFNKDATDGTQLAYDGFVIAEHVATDENGQIFRAAQQYGYPQPCGDKCVVAYGAGYAPAKDILADIAALRAAGMNITVKEGIAQWN